MGVTEYIGKNYKNVVNWGAFSDIVIMGAFALPIIVNIHLANLKKVIINILLYSYVTSYFYLYFLFYFCIFLKLFLIK